jgi:RNA-directed DNA polymerase
MKAYHEIAAELGIKPKFLTHILYGSGKRNEFYTETIINKTGGGTRTIHAVHGRMRMLQKKLYQYLAPKYKPSKFAIGFVEGKSIVENARIHRKNKIVLKFDIKDFFPSITFPRVRGMFMTHPFNFSKEKATALAQICCLEDSGPIPQGAVTSPYISNMICRKLDSRLAGLAKKSRLTYSRYADDMVFSSNDSNLNVQLVSKYIAQIIEDEGFTVNIKKTKALRKNQPQSITGILVNDGLNVRRTYIRNIRAALYKCEISDVLTQSREYYHRIHGRELKWTDDRQLIDPQTKVIFKAQVIKDQFLAHLEGRIQFYGFVARANRGLKTEHFETREGLYLNLLKRLRKIGKSETTRANFAKRKRHAKDSYSDDPAIQAEVESVLNMDLEKLDSFILERENKDERFYVNPIHAEALEDKQIKVIKILTTPQLNINRAVDLYRLLQDSQDAVLGRMLHQDKTVSESSLKDYTIEFLDEHPGLNPQLVNLTDNLLTRARKRFESTKSTEIEFWADTRFRQYIFEYMQRTRFQKADPNTGRNLFKALKAMANDLEKDIPVEARRIVVNSENVKDQEFNTDVVNTLEAIRELLKSMLRNSKGDKILIATRRLPDNTTFLAICDNNKNPHFPTTPLRAQIGHGKIRSVARRLYGLARYSVILNTEESGWMKIDMYSGTATASSEIIGYMHRLEFPQR